MKALVLTAALALVLPIPTAAELLGLATVHGGVGTDNLQPHRVRPALEAHAKSGFLFDDVWIDSTSVETILLATAADPDFPPFAEALTNGETNLLCIGILWASGTGGGGPCGTEAALFSLDSTDFRGYTIDAISLQVDTLRFSEPNEIGGTSAEYYFTIGIEGHANVPVLATSWGRVKALWR